MVILVVILCICKLWGGKENKDIMLSYLVLLLVEIDNLVKFILFDGGDSGVVRVSICEISV